MARTTAKRIANVKNFAIFGLIPLMIFALVLVTPFIRGIFYTFTDWNGFEYEEFVGFAN